MANVTAPARRSRTDRSRVVEPLPLQHSEQEAAGDRSARNAAFHLAANVSGGLFAALLHRNSFKNVF
ncbi:MAG: hypothetical protein WCI19_15260 [Betaproteobacteria bacterium]